jgi:uncharacterized protein YjiS (DUF1127 family)
MLQSFCHAPGFDKTHQALDFAGWSSQPAGFSSSPTATKLRAVWDALREGIAAHRQYEHLRSRGIPHDMAIRQALGISHPVGDRSRKIITGVREMHTSYRHVRPYVDATYATHLPPHPRRFIGGERYAWAGVIRTWLQRSRQRRALAALDDRMLRDIGVTHAQAQREAAKPFWCAGKT